MSTRIFVPNDTTACAVGADRVADAIVAAASSRDLDIELVRNGSRGAFWLEPLVEIESDGVRHAFGPVDVDAVTSLFDAGFPAVCEHDLYLGEVGDISWLADQQR